MMDEQFEKQIDEIANNPDLSKNQKRHAAGKLLRETVERLKGMGKSMSEIGELTGLRASRVRKLAHEIQEHETIWFPGIYGGRQDEPWVTPIGYFPDEQIIELVQKRKMMAWVSDETNIRQCLESIRKEQVEAEKIGNDDYEPRTVDYVCRDLANASKWVGGSRD